ncbi:MAG: hypothetical protein HQL54_14420 [Magnetococcales bacterium]|nr:hypothetical protein [Magnetococcales bacterium]
MPTSSSNADQVPNPVHLLNLGTFNHLSRADHWLDYWRDAGLEPFVVGVMNRRKQTQYVVVGAWSTHTKPLFTLASKIKQNLNAVPLVYTTSSEKFRQYFQRINRSGRLAQLPAPLMNNDLIADIPEQKKIHFVQFGAFIDERKAIALAKKIQLKKSDTFILAVRGKDGRLWNLVLTGGNPHLNPTLEQARLMRRTGFGTPHVFSAKAERISLFSNRVNHLPERFQLPKEQIAILTGHTYISEDNSEEAHADRISAVQENDADRTLEVQENKADRTSAVQEHSVSSQNAYIQSEAPTDRPQQDNATSGLNADNSGFYAGASLGLMQHTVGASDVQSSLLDQGITGTASLDRFSLSGKLYGGYRVSDHFALESNLVHIEQSSTHIEVDQIVDADAYSDAMSKNLPGQINGLSLQGVGIWPTSRLSFHTKAGLWAWKQCVKGRDDSTQTWRKCHGGVDPLIGVGATGAITKTLRGRIEWEHLWLTPEPINLFSIGLELDLD